VQRRATHYRDDDPVALAARGVTAPSKAAEVVRGGASGSPGLGGASAAVGDGGALKAAGVFEDGQRAVYLAVVARLRAAVRRGASTD
jgi:hypothetical protein